ncbi:MAG: hypothetical protein ABS944_07135 [Solibacillus sp.]|uniref:hypothetical protein n=1 Tax=Solibacillus sp. TaxID=1909654 RepID=UPI0033150B3A
MSNFFSRLLWGYVFILLDINIFIDILPDIIGYLLIASALAKLSNVPSAPFTRKMAIIVGIVSILEMAIFESLIATLPSVFEFLVRIIVILSLLIYYYYIFKVCLELLKDSAYIGYTKKVKYFYLISLWFTIMTPYIAIHLYEAEILIVSMIVIYFIAFVTFLIYLYKMKEYARVEEKRKTEILLDKEEQS